MDTEIKKRVVRGLKAMQKKIGPSIRGLSDLNDMSNRDIDHYYVENYIEENPPMFYTVRRVFSKYYWTLGKNKPRINWIKKHIKKLEKELKAGDV